MGKKDCKSSYRPQRKALRNVGRYFHQRGWSLGTSSNYSVVVCREPWQLLVTASGKDKASLGKRDFVVVDRRGQPTSVDQPQASAETMLHVVVAEDLEIGSVLHTHSVWSTLLSDVYFDLGQLELTGLEMLKGLAGIDSHEATAIIKIYDNTQDIAALAEQVRADLAAGAPAVRHALLIRNHGLYTWGRDLAEAKRHIEVLEFLFEVTGRKLALAAHNAPAP